MREYQGGERLRYSKIESRVGLDRSIVIEKKRKRERDGERERER